MSRELIESLGIRSVNPGACTGSWIDTGTAHVPARGSPHTAATARTVFSPQKATRSPGPNPPPATVAATASAAPSSSA